jgi:hypothetical protein
VSIVTTWQSSIENINRIATTKYIAIERLLSFTLSHEKYNTFSQVKKSNKKEKRRKSMSRFISIFVNNFRSQVVIQLTELHFRSCSFITDQSISTYLLAHEFIEVIDLRDCNITYSILSILSKHFPRLTTLYLGQTEHKIEINKNLIDFFPKENCHEHVLLVKPKLKYLSLEGIYPHAHTNEPIDDILSNSLLQSHEQIRFLDLSRNSAIENLMYIDCFKQIHSLVLYDITPKVIESSIDVICRLKTLVVLDLSYNRRTQDAPTYATPTVTLARLIRSLSKLLSLDISGTNLAGNFSFDQDEELVYLKKALSIDEHE